MRYLGDPHTCVRACHNTYVWQWVIYTNRSRHATIHMSNTIMTMPFFWSTLVQGMPQYICLTQWVIYTNRSGHATIDMSGNERSTHMGHGMPPYICLTKWVIHINRSGHVTIQMSDTIMTMLFCDPHWSGHATIMSDNEWSIQIGQGMPQLCLTMSDLYK